MHTLKHKLKTKLPLHFSRPTWFWWLKQRKSWPIWILHSRKIKTSPRFSLSSLLFQSIKKSFFFLLFPRVSLTRYIHTHTHTNFIIGRQPSLIAPLKRFWRGRNKREQTTHQSIYNLSFSDAAKCQSATQNKKTVVTISFRLNKFIFFKLLALF